MHPVDEWFFDWLEYHQLLHPHRGWMKPGDARALDYYAGWIEAFERLGASAELAQRASRRLQENPPRFLNNHLPDLKAAIVELRRVGGAAPTISEPSPEQRQSAIDSHECPECQGTGWAKRFVFWPGIPWVCLVDMFCRCPHGRWRRVNDPDLSNGLPRNYDDLQAHPELWNPLWTFPLWSNRPTVVDVDVEPSTIGQWHYLLPSEPIPSYPRSKPRGLVGGLFGGATSDRRQPEGVADAR